MNKFILEDNLSLSSSSTINPIPKKTIAKKILPIRKGGLRVSNLLAIDNNSKQDFQSRQMTLLDYV